MGSHIQASRFLDSAVLALFAMLISASFLYMFSEFYLASIESKLFNDKLAFILTRLFPFKKSFDYNLTHILLLTICIILLSLKPDYDLYGKLITLRKPSGKKTHNSRREQSDSKEEDEGEDDEPGAELETTVHQRGRGKGKSK